ncbi:biopolymer transporter ExbD [Campylobacter mucosalis]|uniref:ExbD/TolR family protein n=1 Tax=Campylobacter mucosalis TaxID=202 RepID=UPI0004DAC171|nr:biopolymer transporter ExbD [Campylobacter mucosalis]KEA45200.1 biopolymer transporter ExbD [Campylobacter mucosalis]QKF63757.1 TonB system transport protein ExbD [Campylobacter mucosalis]
MTLTNNESELSEINVTPFIDVMLVLLIIFMVVTPIVTSSVKVELPMSKSEEKSDTDKPLILSINEKSELFIKDEMITLENLEQKLDEKSLNNKESVIYFYVDKSVSYEKLMEVVEGVKLAKYSKIAFSTKMPD